jgi:hypothetical protein
MKELYMGINMEINDFHERPTGMTFFDFQSPDLICGVQVKLTPQQVMEFKEKLDRYIEMNKPILDEL